MNHFPVLLLRNLHAPCASQARACVPCSFAVQEHDLRTTPVQCNVKQTFFLPLHIALSPHSTLHTCTSSQLISSELFSSHFMSSQMSAKHNSLLLQTCTYLRTWQHQMTTIMQPFQCDLQPQIEETHRTTHTGTTTRCRTQRRNQFATETSALVYLFFDRVDQYKYASVFQPLGFLIGFDARTRFVYLEPLS